MLITGVPLYTAPTFCVVSNVTLALSKKDSEKKRKG